MRNSFEMREEIVVIVLIVSFAASASLYCQDGMLGKLDGEHGGLKKWKTFYNPEKLFFQEGVLTFPEQTRLNHAIEYQTRAHGGYACGTGVRGVGVYTPSHTKRCRAGRDPGPVLGTI